MPSAVITGCNSGIGHAFAELLLEEVRLPVVLQTISHTLHLQPASSTAPLTAPPGLRRRSNRPGDRSKNQLSRLPHLQPRCTSPPTTSLHNQTPTPNTRPTLRLWTSPNAPHKVTSPQSIADFTKDYGPDKPLDLLLNIAGIMSPPETDSLTTVTQETLLKTFSVNTFGPLLLTSALLPNLTLATEPKVGIMSSRVGSISDNSSGGSYAYRASKTAANSVGKSMAVDLKEQGVAVILLHPGFVKTGLDKSGKTREMGEAIEPGEAAGKLWGVLGGKGLEDSGRFWHREGWEIAW